jgi:MFS family permease
MAETPLPPKRGLFYGYRVLLVAFLCTFIFSGTGVGAFSLFVRPMQAEFGWGRGEIMVAFSLLFLVMGLAAPFIGGLVIAVGALLGGLSLASLYFMQSLWHFYGAYVAVGVAMAATGQVPASVLVSNWFKRRRGVAIGIMSTGIGSGILVLAPIISNLIMPSFGWRGTFLFLALVVWILIPLAIFVVRTRPAEMGLYPDGAPIPRDTPTGSSAASGLSMRAALGTAAFWLIAIAFLVNGFSSMGVIQNQVPHLQDIGFPLASAANALTSLGLGSAIGKLLVGWLCDKINAKYAMAISFVLLAASQLILLSIQPTSPVAMIWFYAIILGFGSGGWLPTMAMLVNVNFGLAAYGAIFGMITLVQSVGGAVGPPFAGYMFDITGSYQQPFVIFVVLYAIALAAMLLVRRPRSPGQM